MRVSLRNFVADPCEEKRFRKNMSSFAKKCHYYTEDNKSKKYSWKGDGANE